MQVTLRAIVELWQMNQQLVSMEEDGLGGHITQGSLVAEIPAISSKSSSSPTSGQAGAPEHKRGQFQGFLTPNRDTPMQSHRITNATTGSCCYGEGNNI